MNTTSHRVYQTGEGERGSEEAVNDLGRLRIRLYDRQHEHFNPPPALRNALPPCPPDSKIINPSSPLEFFPDPLEFLFECLKLCTNRKLALFPLQENSAPNFRSSKTP